MYKAKN